MGTTSHTRVCVVGTARRTWRDPEHAAPEPLSMWEGVSREAIDDVGTHANVAGEIDHLGIVHTQSWSYDDPIGRLSERLGQSGISGTYSILAGTSPQRLLDAAAAAMMRGEVSVALVVGAEAQAQTAQTPGLALGRFNPAPAGDRFFGVPSPFVAGDPALHVMLLGDYVNRLMAFRARGVSRPWIDVRFREFVEDPLSAVVKIYEEAGIGLATEAREAMARWVGENPREDLRLARPADLAPYGIEPVRARAVFSDYCQAFGVEIDGV